MKYDFLIVGAGMFGATAARILTDKGKKCLVIDKRDHIGGNCYSKKIIGVDVHVYGPHIFHTNNSKVLSFISKFTEFNNYRHKALAETINKERVSIPINVQTAIDLGIINKNKDSILCFKEKIRKETERNSHKNDSKNLRDTLLPKIGEVLYNSIYKYYSERQWGRPDTQIPGFIGNRLPIRFSYDDNYFHHDFQGIPKDGYTTVFEKMLEGIDVKLNTSYKDLNYGDVLASYVIYTGPIDELFNYDLGVLNYRSLSFTHNISDVRQDVAIVNNCTPNGTHSRTIDHAYFGMNEGNVTIITKEYPQEYIPNLNEPYYPIGSDEDLKLYNKYKERIPKNMILGGRLAEYKYYDMDQTILSAINVCSNLIS
jgi:UDP-galactopyranose mutase